LSDGAAGIDFYKAAFDALQRSPAPPRERPSGILGDPT
jgi:hypothetical protein